MKLRTFLYLNTKVIEDYVSIIDGYIYSEESQAITTSKENIVEGKGVITVVSGKGSHTGSQSQEVRRSVQISDAAKFDKIYEHLSADKKEGLKRYENIEDTEYEKLCLGDFLEVLVTARFSKMKELTDSAKKINDLATLFEATTGQKIFDRKSAEAVNGFSALGQLNSEKGISCVFEFEDGNYPLVASLDERYFKCKQEHFVGQAYLLCKIIRKLPKGETIELDEIFDGIKNMKLNRTQRRKISKKINNPAEIRDVIKGPALIVLPIAVYQ